MTEKTEIPQHTMSLMMNDRQCRWRRIGGWLGEGFLLGVTSLSLLAVLFIFYFIAKDAWPFISQLGLKEFFTSTKWYPSMEPPEYGVLSIFYGTGMVTLGAVVVAVPLGVSAAVCLSDVLPFGVRQVVKPVVEVIAAIPSVAFGFFALVVFAPVLQNNGGPVLSWIFWVVCLPVLTIASIVLADLLADRFPAKAEKAMRYLLMLAFEAAAVFLLVRVGGKIHGLQIASGTNALNVSFILGIMALPTIVSVSEDALQAAGRELREGSYALGATRAETIVKVVMPASISGIIAGIILGIMRVIGETMVVWMASGNTARIPEPWYNFLEPVRTLTASIAGDMGEAARGTMRYHVLFVMALSLLVISFSMNVASQWIVNRSRKKLGK
jgi:phosphate transport system permease protein